MQAIIIQNCIVYEIYCSKVEELTLPKRCQIMQNEAITIPPFKSMNTLPMFPVLYKPSIYVNKLEKKTTG